MLEDSEFVVDTEPEVKKGLSVQSLLLSILLLVIVLATSIGYYGLFLNSPLQFEGTKVVTVEEGDSVQVITKKLENSGIIKSAELLYLILLIDFDTTKIKASRYVFNQPLSTYQVAETLIQGDFDENLEKLIIFEGESREKMASRLVKEFEWFSDAEFLSLTIEMEGKLFPDTYFLPEVFTTKKLVDLLHATHQEVLDDYREDISNSQFSENEILTLASIVEREANTRESMKLVAGIFQNRLAIGMALQADASIEYVLEHELKDLPPGQLAEALKEIDSPYNTYLYPGLPPTPIGNPGKEAIEAVLFPTESDYLYYLTGNDGNFYYSKTYAEHLANIDRYLKKGNI